MRYAEHEGPGDDATRTFRALRTPATDGVRYADSGSVPDRGGRFALAGWQPRADDDTYPAPDLYAGYEEYAGEPPEAAPERSLTRVYARPADPRQGPRPGDAPRPPGREPVLQRREPAPTGRPLAAGSPGEISHGDRAPRLPLGEPAPEPWLGESAPEPWLAADAPRGTLAGRLSRMRADRWVLAAGGLAAAAAVTIAFVTAGGSGAAGQSGTARTAPVTATRPACVSPAPGH